MPTFAGDPCDAIASFTENVDINFFFFGRSARENFFPASISYGVHYVLIHDSIANWRPRSAALLAVGYQTDAPGV
jgi:hypothetical protein